MSFKDMGLSQSVLPLVLCQTLQVGLNDLDIFILFCQDAQTCSSCLPNFWTYVRNYGSIIFQHAKNSPVIFTRLWCDKVFDYGVGEILLGNKNLILHLAEIIRLQLIVFWQSLYFSGPKYLCFFIKCVKMQSHNYFVKTQAHPFTIYLNWYLCFELL